MKDLFHALDTAVQAPRVLIALDRDGTLVPYAPRPELAVMHEDLANLVCKVSQQPGVDVAVISARSIAQLQGDFGNTDLILAGNYGLEILFPDTRLCVHDGARKAVSTLKTVRDTLAGRINLRSGIILEDHGYSLCLHFQALPDQARKQLRQSVEEMIDEFPQARFRRLATSYEVLPPINWDKGLALDFIVSKIPADGQKRFYFYAGDSEGDLPAFDWIAAHGGISVRIGGSGSLGAQFHLPSTDHLRDILQHILEQRSQTSAA